MGVAVLKLWLFGGNSNNGANCGLAYANSNNAWTNSNANISARLTTLDKKNVRVSVLRHGNAPGHREPRQRARMYSTCWSEQDSTLRGLGSALPPVMLVSRKDLNASRRNDSKI